VVVPASSIECAIAVFRELGLVETRTAFAAGQETRSVRVLPGAGRVELTDSVRYREGLDEQAIFASFKQWILAESTTNLQQRIQRPILPACCVLAEE